MNLREVDRAITEICHNSLTCNHCPLDKFKHPCGVNSYLCRTWEIDYTEEMTQYVLSEYKKIFKEVEIQANEIENMFE